MHVSSKGFPLLGEGDMECELTADTVLGRTVARS